MSSQNFDSFFWTLDTKSCISGVQSKVKIMSWKWCFSLFFRGKINQKSSFLRGFYIIPIIVRLLSFVSGLFRTRYQICFELVIMIDVKAWKLEIKYFTVCVVNFEIIIDCNKINEILLKVALNTIFILGLPVNPHFISASQTKVTKCR